MSPLLARGRLHLCRFGFGVGGWGKEGTGGRNRAPFPREHRLQLCFREDRRRRRVVSLTSSRGTPKWWGAGLLIPLTTGRKEGRREERCCRSLRDTPSRVSELVWPVLPHRQHPHRLSVPGSHTSPALALCPGHAGLTVLGRTSCDLSQAHAFAHTLSPG